MSSAISEQPANGNGGAAMNQTKRGLRAAAIGACVAIGVSLIGAAASSAVAADPPVKQLSVDLADVTGPSTGVGQGILYGITQDGLAAE